MPSNTKQGPDQYPANDGTPDVVVVVPTFNKAEKLGPLLAALSEQTLDRNRFEVVIVDDCSTDGTEEALEQATKATDLNLRIARTDRNSGGPSVPRNIGWRSSRAPVVAFLDDDCLPTPRWLEAAINDIRSNPSWGVTQGRTVAPPEVDLDRLTRWQVARVIEGSSPLFEATNIFYRRQALERLDGFDENLPWWGEDTDLGWRVLEDGWQAGYSPGAVAVHEVVDRGWRWHVKFGWLDQRVIRVAACHPGFRKSAFWRPWAMNRVDAEFALALAGLTLSYKWKPAVALTFPYVWLRRPPLLRDGINRDSIAVGYQTLAVDAVRFAAHVKGSLSSRILVL